MTRSQKIFALLLLFALAYVLAVFLAFAGDYLGLVPVLDARENLAWAARIAQHDLPPEPFYRALFYPWVLAYIPAKPLMASFFGILCHLLNALFCAGLAARIWKSRLAGRTTGLLYAVYPVALFFSVQILDVTFGLTLFLGGLYCLLGAERSHRPSFALSAGLCAGLAVLARPNFLPAVLVFPFLACWLESLRSKAWLPALTRALWVALPLCGLLGLQGVLNQRLSGHFRVLPWQGAYNLYAANREGANGKYYMQRVSFDAVPEGMNTTRMESEYLYRQAAGPDAPMDVDAMGSYWRKELMQEIAADPLRWLGLMGRKTVYLFNDWEQYNNLSYNYHKARLPVLKWNPLGWGLLLLGALLAVIMGRSSVDRGRAVALLVVAVAYAVGVLLFFVSARFRLPLAPLLCVFCGGLSYFALSRLSRIQWFVLTFCLVGVGSLAYGNWLGARNSETFIQDEILLAKAANHLGKDVQALKFAQAVLERQADHSVALRIEVSSLFNLWLANRTAEGGPAYWGALGTALAEMPQVDASTLFVKGVYEWREARPAAAIEAWHSAVSRFPRDAVFSMRALQAVGEETYFEPNDASEGTFLELFE